IRFGMAARRPFAALRRTGRWGSLPRRTCCDPNTSGLPFSVVSTDLHLPNAPGAASTLLEVWADTGGTFTDCLAIDASGTVLRAKVLSSSAIRGRALRVVDAT